MIPAREDHIAALATSRSRRVMGLIANGEHMRLPCGDQRIAHQLAQRGLVILTNPKSREFTSSYRPTPEGMAALCHYLPDFKDLPDD
jgi:hypothetical protein